jgi:superfamily II DNA or RNA helicase
MLVTSGQVTLYPSARTRNTLGRTQIVSIAENTYAPSQKHIYQPSFRILTPPESGIDDISALVGTTELPWPDKYPPRPYLTAAVDHTIRAIDAGQRGIVHLPTGTGKTVKAAKVIQHYHALGKRSLFLHHRKELGAQSLSKFQDFGLDPEIEQSFSRAPKDSMGSHNHRNRNVR